MATTPLERSMPQFGGDEDFVSGDAADVPPRQDDQAILDKFQVRMENFFSQFFKHGY